VTSSSGQQTSCVEEIGNGRRPAEEFADRKKQREREEEKDGWEIEMNEFGQE